jgi:DNA polymerase
MVVGLAPGRLGGDRTGLPFAGDASGRRLRAALGSQVQAVYVTNVVKCAPKACAVKNNGTDLPSVAFDDGLCRIVQTGCTAVNRLPTVTEIERCRRHLVNELAAVRPIGVVALGRLAERSLQQALGRRVRPGPIGMMAGEAPYLAFLPHPASFTYHPDWEDAFLGHLRRLARAAGLPLG